MEKDMIYSKEVINSYFQCGSFRVHAPVYILAEQMQEKRLDRIISIIKMEKLINDMAKSHDIQYMRRLAPDLSLVILTDSGNYDIYINRINNDKSITRTIDIYPSELDTIIENETNIKSGINTVIKTQNLMSKKEYDRYCLHHNINTSPIRKEAYTKKNFTGMERE